MKKAIVLAMHGAPPNDYPRGELAEFFNLHALMERADADQRAAIAERYHVLDQKIRSWPRTPENDPFYAGAQSLADALHRASGHAVFLGFNEFCAPSLEEGLDQAALSGAGRVVVITAMVTRGGEHSEKEIPLAVEAAQERHPQVSYRYVWPLDVDAVADFFVAQAAASLEE